MWVQNCLEFRFYARDRSGCGIESKREEEYLQVEQSRVRQAGAKRKSLNNIQFGCFIQIDSIPWRSRICSVVGTFGKEARLLFSYTVKPQDFT